jgi:hypothetical protein
VLFLEGYTNAVGQTGLTGYDHGVAVGYTAYNLIAAVEASAQLHQVEADLAAFVHVHELVAAAGLLYNCAVGYNYIVAAAEVECNVGKQARFDFALGITDI